MVCRFSSAFVGEAKRDEAKSFVALCVSSLVGGTREGEADELCHCGHSMRGRDA